MRLFATSEDEREVGKQAEVANRRIADRYLNDCELKFIVPDQVAKLSIPYDTDPSPFGYTTRISPGVFSEVMGCVVKELSKNYKILGSMPLNVYNSPSLFGYLFYVELKPKA